jgi:hypothetical protein
MILIKNESFALESCELVFIINTCYCYENMKIYEKEKYVININIYRELKIKFKKI